MTQNEIDKIAWNAVASLFKGTCMELVPSERTRRELLDEEEEMNGMVSFDICEGNPGALAFLMEAYNLHPFKAEAAFQRMQNAGITGSRLYMLWNDCCGRNTEMAMDIMQNKAIDIILHHIDGGRGRGIPFKTEKEAHEQEV